MFKPLPFFITIAAMVSFISGLVTVLSVSKEFGPFVDLVLAHSSTVNTVALYGIVIFFFILPFAILNSKLYFCRAQLHDERLDNRTLRALLDESRQLLVTDVITGIPNQVQFYNDIEWISKNATFTTSYQLIFIDLVNFGELNNKFGYDVGDDVVEYFARTVKEDMRRSENIYKMPFDEKFQGEERWKRAYRKHTGGDEFLFLVGGAEVEALGFLVRLQRLVDKELNAHIQSKILRNSDWSLSFYGAIVPVYPEDNNENVLQRAHEGMRKARQPGSKCRVFWASKLSSEDISEDPKDVWKKKIYSDAEKMFSLEEPRS